MLTPIEDAADQGDTVMHITTNNIPSLFGRGRHLGCVRWLLTQKPKVVSLIVRTNFCWMLVWRLRNSKELNNGILEELDALVDRKTLLEMYKQATAEKHSFWYINLLGETDQMFYKTLISASY